MKRNQKKWAVFAAVLFFLIMSLVLARYFVEQKIKEQLDEGLRQIFALEMDDYEVDLSFTRQFPRASICIKYLTFYKSIEIDTASLFHLHQADFQMDLFSLFQDTINIAKAEFSNGHIHLITDSIGQNTPLFRYRTDEERFKNEPINIHFQELIFKKINVSIDNQYKKTNWSLTVDSADLSGHLRQRIWTLAGTLEGHFDSLTIRKEPLIKHKPIRLTTLFEHRSKTRESIFKDAILTYENASFDAHGVITKDYPNGNLLDLTLTGKEDFGTLLGLLPPDLKPNIRQTNTDASTKIKGNIKGLSGPTSNAAMNLLIDIQQAALESLDYPARFEELDFLLEYHNGEQRNGYTSEVIIKTFSGLMNQKPVAFAGSIVNLIEPAINMDFDLNMDLQDFRQFFPIKGIKEMGGLLSLKGSYQKEAPSAPTNIKIDGNISLDGDNLRFDAEGFDFTNLKGEIDINDNQLNIKRISGIFSEIPFTMTGTAENIYRLFLKNEGKLIAKANAYSDLANLNTILNTVISGNLNTPNRGNPLAFPEYLHGDLTMNTPKLIYKNTLARSVKTKILFRGEKISIPFLNMDVLDGKLSINAKLQPEKKGNYAVYAQMNAKDINTKKLLNLYDNFKQDVLTAEKIEGKLSADVKMQGLLNNELNYIENEISYDAKFTLKDGELIDFEPVTEAFENFRKRARAHLYVDYAEGEVFYNRGEMIVPHIYFTSNLSAVELFGERQPTEEMNFFFNFSLTDLLFGNAQKRRKRKKEKKKPGNFHIQLGGKPHNLIVNAIRRSIYTEAERKVKLDYDNEKNIAFP